MDKHREFTVEYGSGKRKGYINFRYKGTVNDFLESIKDLNKPYVELFNLVNGERIVLWSKDQKGILQQGEQMELF